MSPRNVRCEAVNHTEAAEATRKVAADCLELRRSLADMKDYVAQQIHQLDSGITHKLEGVFGKRFQAMLTAQGVETRTQMEQLTEMRSMIKDFDKAIATLNSDMLEQLNAIRETLGTEQHPEWGSLRSELGNCWQRIVAEKDDVEERLEVLRQAFDGEVQSRSKESALISSELSHLRDRVDCSSMEFNANLQIGQELSSTKASPMAPDADGVDMEDHLTALRGELAREVQLREAALSGLMEAVSLETNARVAKGAELRRELHAMVQEYGDRSQPIDKLEQSLQDTLKEVSKLWHALNVHTRAINVDVAGNLCARQPTWSPMPSLPPRQIRITPTTSFSPPLMEASPHASSPPMVVLHPPRVLPLSVSDPHLGVSTRQVPLPGDGMSSPQLRQVSSPRMLVRACAGSPFTYRQADVDAQSVITTKTILPSTVQPAVVDVDAEGLVPIGTREYGDV